ncbi:MAG: exosortase/archaeosortase family protein [Azonexus sp.]|jgi:hypothetical protein|nr:exosortase/archaeosortase family protein [Azonexus sp.]
MSEIKPVRHSQTADAEADRQKQLKYADQQERLKWLLWWAALACWFVSLGLPGFFVEGAGVYSGLEILLLGLRFGWLVNGWAVYANVFFPVLLVSAAMRRKRIPLALVVVSIVLMLLLAASLPLFAGVPVSTGGWNILGHKIIPVSSWGWGAVVWLTALLLAVAAVGLEERWLRGGFVIGGLLGLVGIYIAVVVFHEQQWSTANSQERELYLESGMAFTVIPLCGAELTWPEGPLVATGEIPELDIDPALQAKEPPYLELPDLEHYQSNGFEWIWNGGGQFYNDHFIKVRSPASQPPRYTLQAKPVGHSGAVVRLIENATGQVLYEQKLNRQPQRVGQDYFIDQYCPNEMTYNNNFYADPRNYTKAVLRVLGQTGEPIAATDAQRQLREETAQQPCDMGTEDIDGIKGLRTWDGRQAILEVLQEQDMIYVREDKRNEVRDETNEALRQRKGFCSDNYIVLAINRGKPSSERYVHRGEINIFDRHTLRPLRSFRSKECRSESGYPANNHDGPSDCPDISNEIITGIRISNDYPVIETTQGDIPMIE